jgi:putative transposase
MPNRQVFAGIVYRLRTGCQWKALPTKFGSGSTCHLRFSTWVRLGVFAHIMHVLVQFYENTKGIDWDWSALDAMIVKAPKGGMQRVPTRRTAQKVARNATSLPMATACP